MSKNLLILNKTLFLFLFFIFKYYIFSNIYNKLNNKYIIKIFFSNKININFYYYIFYILLYNKNLYLFLNYIIRNKINNNILLYNLNLYIIIEMLNYNIYFNNFKFDYFKKKKNIKIFFFFDFYLRIDILIFITYKYYINYFRIFKYNEYLNIHPNLQQYPLLKIFLRNVWEGRRFKYHKNLFSEQSILKFFKIYIFNKKSFEILTDCNLNLGLVNLNLHFNNFKFIKFLDLLKKNNYSLLYLYFGKFFKIHLYFFIYNLTVFNYEEDDWVEIKKFRLQSLENNFWQLNRYGFNIAPWLFMVVLSYISKMYIKNNLYLYNIYNLDLIKYSKLHYLNIFWYSLIKLIIIEKINFYYFLWSTELVLNKRKRKNSLIRFIKIWHILINSYIFQFISLKLDNYKNIIDYLKNIKFNLDFIFWNIFFIGTVNYRINFEYNIISIINKINIDMILYSRFGLYFDFFRFFLGYNFSPFFIMNVLFLFLFLHDLYIKILINKNLDILKIKSKFLFIKTYKNLKYIKKSNFNFYLKKFLAYNVFNNYKFKNNNYYIFYFENNLIIAVCIIIIKKLFL